jgi:fructose-1,6-bisphosphatase/inositol monophosphatase family enzyme
LDNLFKTKDFNFFKKLLVDAGELAKKFQNGTIEVVRKADASIVTQADPAVQDFIITRISNRYAGFNFIYEENFSGRVRDIDDSTVSIIIDPIDGTAMFSMYLPVWCISVGVFKGYDPVYGFVYVPGFDMFFYNDDRNAYLNNEVRAVDSDMRIDSESNIFHASEAHSAFDFEFNGKVRNLGSTAIHACLLVDNIRNRTVAFIGKSNLWDWAGAIPILLKAGSNLKYISGDSVDYRSIMRNDCRLVDYLVAYNLRDFEEVKKIFRKRQGGACGGSRD